MKVLLIRRLAAVALAAVVGVAAGLAAVPLSARAIGTVLGAGRADAVSGSYLVVLRDPVVVTRAAAGLVARHGGQVGFTYSAAIRGFSVTMSEPAAKRMAADAAVAWVEQDHLVRPATSQPNPPSWGLNRIDQRMAYTTQWNAYTYGSNGSGVHVYVIDSGIRFSHTDFGGRASSGYDLVDGGSADDCFGHGTYVSGTIAGSQYGVAKGAQLVAVRVSDCAGGMPLARVVAGIDWVTGHAIHPAVANLSLETGATPTLDTAVTNSINSGITYTVAAGNFDNDACDTSPASVPAAITVGATNASDQRSAFGGGYASNYGPCLDLFAPGSTIPSTWHTSNTATHIDSGTSIAAPHAAGVAATILSAHPAWTPAQVRNKMVADATPGKVGNAGAGSPNLLLYTQPPLSVHLSGPGLIPAKATYGVVRPCYGTRRILAAN